MASRSPVARLAPCVSGVVSPSTHRGLSTGLRFLRTTQFLFGHHYFDYLGNLMALEPRDHLRECGLPWLSLPGGSLTGPGLRAAGRFELPRCSWCWTHTCCPRTVSDFVLG